MENYCEIYAKYLWVDTCLIACDGSIFIHSFFSSTMTSILLILVCSPLLVPGLLKGRGDHFSWLHVKVTQKCDQCFKILNAFELLQISLWGKERILLLQCTCEAFDVCAFFLLILTTVSWEAQSYSYFAKDGETGVLSSKFPCIRRVRTQSSKPSLSKANQARAWFHQARPQV